jgi:alpha-galactosidase
MSEKPTITIIGAASTTFGPKVLRDILNHPGLGGSTYHFVDINEERLAVYDKLAHRLNGHLKTPSTIHSSTNRRALLPESDYVILSVDTGHYNTWRQDFDKPVEFGIRQIYGELGGPGGLFHSLRQIPLHLEIAADIAELCPNARILIASNPLNRICLALERYANLGQIVGLCHGAEMAPHLYLNRVLGIDGYDMDFLAVGVNHFTWILDIRRKSTGEDLYPLMKEVLARIPPDEQVLSRKMLEVYGYFPGTLDTHFGEYIPFAYEFGYRGLDFNSYLAQEQSRWQYLKELAEDDAEWDQYEQRYGDQSALSKELRLDQFFAPRSWADTLAFPIINALFTNERHYMPAINLLNQGTIDNLPADVFVEGPAMIDGAGIHPFRIGPLPKPLAAFIRRDIDQMEMIVEAAVKGDRNLVLQAMLLDPVVDHVGNAERLLDEMMRINAPYLPQFA